MNKMNDQAYWDARFAKDWDANGGRQQSAFFAHVALQMLPA